MSRLKGSKNKNGMPNIPYPPPAPPRERPEPEPRPKDELSTIICKVGATTAIQAIIKIYADMYNRGYELYDKINIGGNETAFFFIHR